MWTGYMFQDDENRKIDIDPTESDEALWEYIERNRSEFYEEWFQYLKENQ